MVCALGITHILSVEIRFYHCLSHGWCGLLMSSGHDTNQFLIQAENKKRNFLLLQEVVIVLSLYRNNTHTLLMIQNHYLISLNTFVKLS